MPKDYEGAYEKSLKKGSGSVSVSPIMSSGHSQPVAEHPETEIMMWPMLSTKTVPRRKPPSAPAIPLVNKFGAFTSNDQDEDDDDEEESLVKALNSMTSHVEVSSQKSRPQREKKKGMSMSYLNSVARKVKSGEITLPNLDLETDDDFDYVWAMVDSGAGANVARRDHFPNFTPVKAPQISLTIANGDVMANQGAGEVVSYSRDGSKSRRVFYEAPVEMPILAVAELSKEGEMGSEVRFRMRDGFIVDNLTGRRVQFAKRKGVYFMKLYFQKNKQSFPRPDQ